MSEGMSVIAGTFAALNDQIDIPCDGYDWVAADVSGTLSGTITATVSADGVVAPFRAVQLISSVGGLSALGQIANAGSVVLIPVTGVRTLRLKCTAYTSGTGTLTATLEDGGGNPPYSLIIGNPVLSAAIIPSTSVSTPFVRLRAKSAGATTAGVSVKGTAGNVHHIVASNTQAATQAFLKLYDKATAAVVGTDVPVMTILLPAASTIVIPYDLIRQSFTLGISYGITGLAPDADATAVAADLVFLSMLYF